MINFLKKYWLLILIIILAIFLRFYKLGSYPALNADEASNGYDAYSLIQTGMDQHGHSWPITFQSFNDYKPGLYVYIILPFVKVLGLNEWAVRIPNAAFGVLSVLIIYLLVMELFKDRKFALFSAIFLAISPWAIQFSRGGWEVNTSTFFILFGAYLFIMFVKLHKWQHLFLSILILVLSLYTYHAARVVIPLLGLSGILIYRKEIYVSANAKKIVLGIIFGILIILPLLKDLSSPGAISRVAGVGLFADQGPINRINEQRGEHGNVNSVLGKIIHNKVINYGLAFANNWTSHFNGEFLFMSGDSVERNKVPETGEMYLFDIIFLAVGFIFLSKKYDSGWKFVISWLIIAPVASALTFQSPNALRAENMVIPLTMISAFGLTAIIDLPKPLRRLRIAGYILIILVVCWNFGRYLDMYYLHMGQVYPYSSQYGLKELVIYVAQNQSKYKDIFVTERYDQPYILFLFYMKYPPQMFQFHHALTTRDEFGFSTVADFDKYHFGSIDFTALRNDHPGSLIIGTPEEIPASANIIKRIYGTNGFEYFDVVAN